MRIRSNLKLLLDERNLSIRQVQKDLDTHFEPLRKLYHDDMERYPRDLLSKLCTYLGVEIGELLKLEKDSE